MSLLRAQDGVEYTINNIVTDDEEMDAFLFSLGCYSGEPITVVRRVKGGCVVSIKDGRYTIDNLLAEAIVVNAM
ncbi:MAG: ferrous iron transport protein A [Anaerotignum sp.]|nr:ferrous iron transport protein A [Anaerotignum sp.]MBQ7083708.1 ferrous iron transport protein A [Anaerotignum sp.]MBR2851455.1 ferrous iron transport protein A [Anaerotignum sp.]